MATLNDRFQQWSGANAPESPSAAPVDGPAPGTDGFAENLFGTDNETPLQAFGGGVRMGIDQTQALGYGLASMVGKTLGIKSIDDWGWRGYQRNMEEAQQNAPNVTSLSDISTFDDAVDWAFGAFGQAVPSLAGSIASGGAGWGVARYAAGRTIANAYAKQALEKEIGKEAVKLLTKRGLKKEFAREGVQKVLKDPVTRANMGKMIARWNRNNAATAGMAGAFGFSQPMGVGEVYTELREQGIEAPGTAAVFGTAVGALDIIPEAVLASKLVKKALSTEAKKAALKGTDSIMKMIGKNIVQQGAMEGATEGGQEYLQLLARLTKDETFDINTRENMQRVLDAAAAGAVVGVFTGTGGGMVDYLLGHGEKPQQEQRAKDKDQPSAERPSDLRAQLRDLKNPQHPRKAVLVPEENWKATTDDQIRWLMENFIPVTDKRLPPGRVFVANEAEEKALLADLDAGMDPQEALGRRLLAGTGKPDAAPDAQVTQGLDENGAVVVESAHTPADAAATQERVATTPGVAQTRQATPEQVIAERQAGVAQEGAGIQLAPSGDPQQATPSPSTGTRPPVELPSTGTPPPAQAPAGAPVELAPSGEPPQAAPAPSAAPSVLPELSTTGTVNEVDDEYFVAREVAKAERKPVELPSSGKPLKKATQDPTLGAPQKPQVAIELTPSGAEAKPTETPAPAKNPVLESALARVSNAAKQVRKQNTRGGKKGTLVSVETALHIARGDVRTRRKAKGQLTGDVVRHGPAMTEEEGAALMQHTGKPSVAQAITHLIEQQRKPVVPKADVDARLDTFIKDMPKQPAAKRAEVAKWLLAHGTEEQQRRFEDALDAVDEAPVSVEKPGEGQALPHTPAGYRIEPGRGVVMPEQDEDVARTKRPLTRKQVYDLTVTDGATVVPTEASKPAKADPAEAQKRLNWLRDMSWQRLARNLLTITQMLGHGKAMQKEFATDEDAATSDLEAVPQKQSGDRLVLGANNRWMNLDSKQSGAQAVPAMTRTELEEQFHAIQNRFGHIADVQRVTTKVDGRTVGYIVLEPKEVGDEIAETSNVRQYMDKAVQYVQRKLKRGTNAHRDRVIRLLRSEHAGYDENGKPINEQASIVEVRASDITKLGRKFLLSERGADKVTSNDIRSERPLQVDEEFWYGMAKLYEDHGGGSKERPFVTYRLSDEYRTEPYVVEKKGKKSKVVTDDGAHRRGVMLPSNLVLWSRWGSGNTTVGNVYGTRDFDPEMAKIDDEVKQATTGVKGLEAEISALLDQKERAGDENVAARLDAQITELETQRKALKQTEFSAKVRRRKRQQVLDAEKNPRRAALLSQPRQRRALSKEDVGSQLKVLEARLAQLEADEDWLKVYLQADKDRISSPQEGDDADFQALVDAETQNLEEQLAEIQIERAGIEAEQFWLRQSADGMSPAMFVETYGDQQEMWNWEDYIVDERQHETQQAALNKAARKSPDIVEDKQPTLIRTKKDRKKKRTDDELKTDNDNDTEFQILETDEPGEFESDNPQADLDEAAAASKSEMLYQKTPHGAEVMVDFKPDTLQSVAGERATSMKEAAIGRLVSRVVEHFKLPVHIGVLNDVGKMEDLVRTREGAIEAARMREQISRLPREANGYIYRMNGAAYIYLKPGMGMKELVRVLAHELGHVVPNHYYHLLTIEQQNALKKAHAEAKQENSFEEWLANQFAKWADTKAKPKTWIEEFFAKIGRKLKELFKLVKEEYALNETFEQFMDGVETALQGKREDGVTRKDATIASYFHFANFGDRFGPDRVPPADIVSYGNGKATRRARSKKLVATFRRKQGNGTEISMLDLTQQAKAHAELLNSRRDMARVGRYEHEADARGNRPRNADEEIEFNRDYKYGWTVDAKKGEAVVYKYEDVVSDRPFSNADEAQGTIRQLQVRFPEAQVVFNPKTRMVDVVHSVGGEAFAHTTPHDGTPVAKERMNGILGEMKQHYEGVKGSKPAQYLSEALGKYWDAAVNTAHNRVRKMNVPAFDELLAKFSLDPGKTGTSADGTTDVMGYGRRHQRDMVELMDDMFGTFLPQYWQGVKAKDKQADAGVMFKPEFFKSTRSYHKLKALNVRLKTYMENMGLKVDMPEGFFPVMINWEAMRDNVDRVREDLLKATVQDMEESAKRRLTDMEMAEAVNTVELLLTEVNNVPTNMPLETRGWEGIDMTQNDIRKSVRNIELSPRQIEALNSNNALHTDPALAYRRFVRKAVDLAVFNHYFGDTSWNRSDAGAAPEYGKALKEIFKKARAQGATEDQIAFAWDAVSIGLGRYALSSSRALNTFNDAMLLYQSMRTLTFTLFASFPDLSVPMIRFADSGLVMNGMKNYLWEALQGKGAGYEMARSLGHLQVTADQYWTMELAQYEPQKFIKNMSQKFFKAIQMERWSNAMKAMNAAIGRDFLVKHAEGYATDPNSKRYLDELGVSPEDIKVWKESGFSMYGQNGYSFDELSLGITKKTKEEIAAIERASQAISRVIDETSLHANALEKPAWANEPMLKLFWHLKSFMYSYYQKVIKRAYHEYKARGGQIPTAYFGAFAMAMGLAAFGLALRDLLQYQLWGNEGYVSKMSPSMFLYQSFIRTGFLGPAQLIVDMRDAANRGRAPAMALAGPTATWAFDFVQYPFYKTIPTSVPVVSQLPFIRDPIREGLKSLY